MGSPSTPYIPPRQFLQLLSRDGTHGSPKMFDICLKKCAFFFVVDYLVASWTFLFLICSYFIVLLASRVHYHTYFMAYYAIKEKYVLRDD